MPVLCRTCRVDRGFAAVTFRSAHNRSLRIGWLGLGGWRRQRTYLARDDRSAVDRETETAAGLRTYAVRLGRAVRPVTLDYCGGGATRRDGGSSLGNGKTYGKGRRPVDVMLMSSRAWRRRRQKKKRRRATANEELVLVAARGVTSKGWGTGAAGSWHACLEKGGRPLASLVALVPHHTRTTPLSIRQAVW